MTKHCNTIGKAASKPRSRIGLIDEVQALVFDQRHNLFCARGNRNAPDRLGISVNKINRPLTNKNSGHESSTPSLTPLSRKPKNKNTM